MAKKAYGDMNLDDVRALVKEVHAEGLKIQSHYKRLEQEYSDWEDRVYELDKIISQAEKDTGLSREEIEKDTYSLPDDLLGLTNIEVEIKEENIIGEDDESIT